MDPQDNKQLALQKAINSHEQAAAALADLMGTLSEERYGTMLSRIKQNLAELHADMERSKPDDRV